MNKKEETYFLALSEDRSEIANVLDRRAVRGYKDSVVEKYSDQAHFIYELLQNADDACATRARFILEENRLIFAHNGSRHFSVSNPANEDVDSENKTLGDINAITSIANSNKTGASIGKFGVGFKAVFQYTQTPYIYDPNFRFKIERFIVPVMLTDDFPGRRFDETLFVFPFNHQERDAAEAYSDISNKLRNLSYPLLFLTRLKYIEFEFDNVLGLYGKDIKETIKLDGTIAEHMILTQNAGDDLYDEDLWLFSRLDECERRYSVGFFVDREGHLRPVNEPAFCFFPTKEVTNLNFILHAPFLLTDSREGIRAGVVHNDKMIKRLADLAADSMEYLRDIGVKKSNRLINDNIVEIIPVDESDFSDPSDKRKVSFLPFYESIKKKFEVTELIPTLDDYVMPDNAYWAAVPQLAQLFSNVQLGEITENKDAQWAFVSLGRDEVQRNNKALFNYIEDLVKTNLNEDAIINGRSRDFYYNRVLGVRQSLESVKGITGTFIENQEISWLHEFYKWLSETKHRMDVSTDKPIFLDQNGKAAAAFDDEEQLILFLPVKGVEGYKVVNEELLKNKDTLEFIKSIGVKQPSLKDQIYNIILPQYTNEADIDTNPHFMIFFNYYCKCSNEEIEEFIDLIKAYDFLTFYEDGVAYRGRASEMYMPTDELVRYFESKPSTRFIDLDSYKSMVGREREKYLISFLTELGVKSSPSVYTERNDGYYSQSSENFVDGLREIIESVEESKDSDLSAFLWKQLCVMVETNKLNYYVLKKTLRTRPDGRYKFRTEYEDSSTKVDLTSKKWLVNNEGVFVVAKELTKGELSSIYDIENEGAASLLAILDISDVGQYKDESEDDSYLTDTQREKIEFADKLNALGINEDDLEDFKEFKKQKEAQKRVTEIEHNSRNGSSNGGQKNIEAEDIDDLLDDEEDKETSEPKEKKKINKAITDVIKDFARRTKERGTEVFVSEITEDDDTDEDELMPSAIDYSKKIERAKQKSAAEIDKITYFEELQKKVLSTERYSYGWFTTLLEMESINGDETNSRSREVYISFAKVEKEPGTKRTLVLKHPNRYIPQFMEDLSDIPLVLHMGDQTKTVAIEVANIKSYTLRVKMKNTEAIDDIDLSMVTSATIDAKSPAFLLEELRKQFAEFEFDDDYNMQENLCENIEFVFGPPGTGKTTHLVKNVLLPIMKNSRECKVLVLTPTNKSADVLVNRIMEVSGSDTSYNDWLVRFGATGEEKIEQSPVFRDKTFDIRTLVKNVTVTTIARFPYDFFMPDGARIFLNGMNWDYIIIDEASMIPLVNIVYPLYKKTPKKFIIAGDPFQIEPITSIDLWKNENIYTMVHLDSFVKPETIPYQYKVEFLTTQYRSVPDIGDVFSNFAYGGILKHYRSADSQRPLNVGNDLGIETLNVIKFPVSKYESIYRCKRLQHSSSYQVYSAIFTFEYVSYLSRAIAENNPGELFRIGVIAPYRAQADMIDKLLASENFPKEVNVQVGTIHGFQGDECDIIFAVFNTPPSISASKEMFLNKKNIINVSISRARDYLFIVMPDDKTENIDNLRLVKKVEGLIQSTDAWNEFASPDLEDLMFGDSKYLENNAFSTSHQSVNVYCLPEKIYEVRTEDTAVDVQIHRAVGQAVPIEKTANKISEDYDSYNLDKALIPEKLRRKAIDLHVRGAINGWCYLVPYEGKLKHFTVKKTVGMFIPIMRNGQEKMVSVSVVEEERIIYISSDMFKIYEQGLREPKGIRLKKSFC